MYPGFSATLLFIVAGALSMAVANRSRPPLLACCVGVAAWATSLCWLHPGTQAIGERLLMVGFFVPAAFLHAAHEATGRRPGPVHDLRACGCLLHRRRLRANLFLRRRAPPRSTFR